MLYVLGAEKKLKCQVAYQSDSVTRDIPRATPSGYRLTPNAVKSKEGTHEYYNTVHALIICNLTHDFQNPGNFSSAAVTLAFH